MGKFDDILITGKSFVSRRFLIQRLEPATLAFKQLIRLAVFDKLTLVHDDNLVKVKNSVKLMCNSKDSVRGELGSEQALNMGVRCLIQATKN